MEENRTMMCARCNVELISENAYFSYLGHSFHTDIPRCPKCGQVFIPESLASGKMSEVEISLEDK